MSALTTRLRAALVAVTTARVSSAPLSPSPDWIAARMRLAAVRSAVRAVIAFAVVLLSAPAARADDAADREAFEDALFGGGDDPASSPAPSPTPADPPPADDRDAFEDALFGGGDDPTPSPDPTDATARPAATPPPAVSLPDASSFVDTLAVGGRLFMQLVHTLRADDDINAADLASPNLLDVYLDARPNDRVRVYIRGRVTHDFTVRPDDASPLGQGQEQTTVALNQLWLKFDIARAVFVTLGRQPIRWGSARFWNPTDFLNQAILDPLAVFDVRLGVSLLKLHIPFESEGFNLYVIADLEGATALGDVGGALRAEYLIGPLEVALSAYARQDRPVRLGLDLSTGLGLFDVRVEAATRYNDKTPFDEGSFDLAAGRLPTQRDRSGEWLTQVAVNVELGLKYSDQDSVYLGAEYLFNQTGYGSGEGDLLPWKLFQGRYVPLYAGRHYGSLYMSLPSPGDLNDATIILSTLGNLSDLSFQTRLDYRHTVLTYLALNAYVNAHFGEIGEFRLAFDVPPNPQLPDGFSLSEPIFGVGFGAQLNF